MTCQQCGGTGKYRSTDSTIGMECPACGGMTEKPEVDEQEMLRLKAANATLAGLVGRQHKRIMALQAERDTLKERVRVLEEENARLHAACNKFCRERASTQDKNEELESENTALVAQLAVERSRKIHIQAVDTLKERVRELEADGNRMSAAALDADTELINAFAERDALAAQLAVVREAVANDKWYGEDCPCEERRVEFHHLLESLLQPSAGKELLDRLAAAERENAELKQKVGG